MVKAIIFDLDGTLVNSAPDIRTVLNGSLAKFGLPPVSLEKLYSILGDGAYNLVYRAVPADKKQLVKAVYDDYVPAYAAWDNSATALYEGEAEALLKVQTALAEGFKLLNDAAPTDSVVKIKALEAFAKAADGKATKIIIPSEIQGIAGLAASAKEVFKDEKA